MKRNAILWTVGGIGVLAFIALRTQQNARRDMERERAYASILMRTMTGFPEWYSQAVPLSAADRGVTWSASVFADHSRPEFSLVFANEGEPRETWEADAKKPVAVIADGRRYSMKPFQSLVSDDGDSVTQVSVVGSRSILEAVVTAKKAEIEFDVKLYALDAQGMPNCRELLKRSGADARKRE
jgi:hypothetical protein